jgi:LPXTG-motif cell wall-anchored protein
MRKVVGVLVLAILAGIALPLASAGAGTTTTGSCTFTVTPTTLPSGGGSVTVSGTAPEGSTITVFKNGVKDGTTTAADDGSWSIVVSVTATTDITVSFGTNYPPAACAPGPIRVTVAAAVTPAQQLAFTGSSNTLTYVLAALAAITLGTILVVGVRRRREAAHHSG